MEYTHSQFLTVMTSEILGEMIRLKSRCGLIKLSRTSVSRKLTLRCLASGIPWAIKRIYDIPDDATPLALFCSHRAVRKLFRYVAPRVVHPVSDIKDKHYTRRKVRSGWRNQLTLLTWYLVFLYRQVITQYIIFSNY